MSFCFVVLAREQNDINTKLKKTKKQKTTKTGGWGGGEDHHEDSATLKSLSLDNFWLPADGMSFFCLKIEK